MKFDQDRQLGIEYPVEYPVQYPVEYPVEYPVHANLLTLERVTIIPFCKKFLKALCKAFYILSSF